MTPNAAEPLTSSLRWVSLVTLALVAILWTSRKIISAYASPLRAIPGPLIARLSNIRLKVAVITGRRMHYIQALHERYGDVVLISPSEVSVADLDSAKKIHAISGGFLKTKWYQDLTIADRPGVFALVDAKAHAARRRLLARPFSKTSLREWEPEVRSRVQLAVDKMQETAAAAGGKTDVLKWWTFMATDVITKLSFGEDFGMLTLGKENEYITTLTGALIASSIGTELPWIRHLSKAIPVARVQKFFNPQDFLLAYGKRAVNNAKTGGLRSNIFAGMIQKAEDADGLDEIDVSLEASNLLVAGSDTTANTLTFLTWAVLQRPSLRDELSSEVSKLPADYTDEDLESLPLLNAVIEESLRLYGAAPGSLPRSVPDGGTVLAGYSIPSGTVVSTQAYTLHRLAQAFTDPLTFDPQRWLQEPSEAAKTAFMPFGRGTRVCLGVHLARMELRLATAVFFRSCGAAARLAPETTDESMGMLNHFLVSPIGGKCEVILS